jgi:hypothetical protein
LTYFKIYSGNNACSFEEDRMRSVSAGVLVTGGTLLVATDGDRTEVPIIRRTFDDETTVTVGLMHLLSEVLSTGGAATVVDGDMEFGRYPLVEPLSLDHDHLHSVPSITVRVADPWTAWATAIWGNATRLHSLSTVPFVTGNTVNVLLVRELAQYVDLSCCVVTAGEQTTGGMKFHQQPRDAAAVANVIWQMLTSAGGDAAPVAICMGTEGELSADIALNLVSRQPTQRPLGLYMDPMGALAGALMMAQSMPTAG